MSGCEFNLPASNSFLAVEGAYLEVLCQVVEAYKAYHFVKSLAEAVGSTSVAVQAASMEVAYRP